MSHCRKKMPRVLRGKKNQCKQWRLMKEVKLKRKFSKGKELEITEYTPHTSHLSAVISLAEIKCFTWNRLKQSSDLNRRRQWHTTPVLLPGKSHGQGAWKATVHGVTEGQTQLSDFTFMHWRRKWQPTPVFLPGESQGQGSLVGCHLWGHTELDTTEAT